MRKANRAGTVWSGEEAQGDLINVCKYLKAECRENGARLLSVVLSTNWNTGGSSEHQEEPLCCADDGALALVAQRLLGDLPQPPGHGPWSGCPCWSRGWATWTQKCLPTSTILFHLRKVQLVPLLKCNYRKIKLLPLNVV